MARITVEGLTTTTVLSPSTSTGPVYAVGDQVGSVVTVIPAQSSDFFRGAVLDSVSLIHLDASVTAQLDLFIIYSAGNITSSDATPIDILDATARSNVINCGTFLVSGWTALASNSVNSLRNLKIPIESGSSSAPGTIRFVLKLSGGSISFTTTASLHYIVTFRSV